ncbi:ATP-binding protein [Sutterella wadsworthensis]
MRREENRIRQGIMGAHFPMVRTLEVFSQTEQSAIDPRVLRELAQLEWLEQAQNVIFFGPPGTGKTHWPLASGEPPLQPTIKSLSTIQIISSRSWNKPERRHDGLASAAAEQAQTFNHRRVWIYTAE